MQAYGFFAPFRRLSVLAGVLERTVGLLMRQPRQLMRRKVIALAVSYSCGVVSMCGKVVQLGGTVVRALRHGDSPICLL